MNSLGTLWSTRKGLATHSTLNIPRVEAKRALDDKDMTIHNFKIYGKGEEGIFVGAKSSEMVGFEPDPNKRSKCRAGKGGLRRRKNADWEADNNGVISLNETFEHSRRAEYHERSPARQYNCCQRVIDFVFGSVACM